MRAKLVRWYRGLLQHLAIERYTIENISVTSPEGGFAVGGAAVFEGIVEGMHGLCVFRLQKAFPRIRAGSMEGVFVRRSLQELRGRRPESGQRSGRPEWKHQASQRLRRL